MSQTYAWGIGVSGIISILALGSVAVDFLFRDRRRVNERLNQHFQKKAKRKAEKSPLFKDLEFAGAETLDTSLLERLTNLLEQSGLALTVQQFASICGVLMLLVAGLIFGLTQNIFTAVLTSLLLSWVPLVYINSRRTTRVRKICQQLPDAFEVMSRALQTGQTFPAAFQMVAESSASPLKEEFACFHEQVNLGLSQEVALRDLAKRTGVIELQMFVVTVLVVQQSGGNPVEILENLATVIRKRIKLQGKLRALTGEGRMQAAVLMVLPVLIYGAMQFLNPDYANKLLESPKLLIGIICSEIIGALWIRRILNAEL